MGRRPLAPVERAIRRAFSTQKSSAKARGITFELTFQQWWDVWAPHWGERGTRVGQKCMCRTRDEGGYTLGNVRIDTVTANVHERTVAARVKTAHRRLQSNVKNIKIAAAIDWIKPHHVDEESEIA